MIIKLEQKDYYSFFNMLAVYKVYADLSEEEKRIITPPISAVDLLINELGEIIVDSNFYETNLEEANMFLQLAKFSLGTGNEFLNHDVLSKLYNCNSNSFFLIKKNELFNFLLDHEIEV